MSTTTKNVTIKKYLVKGHFKDHDETVKFTKEIRTISESDAKEKTYLHFGSKHSIKRQAIKFDSVSEMKEKSEDPVDEVLSSSEDFSYSRG